MHGATGLGLMDMETAALCPSLFLLYCNSPEASRDFNTASFPQCHWVSGVLGCEEKRVCALSGADTNQSAQAAPRRGAETATEGG